MIDPGDVAIETDALEIKPVSIASTSSFDNSDLLVVTIDPF